MFLRPLANCSFLNHGVKKNVRQCGAWFSIGRSKQTSAAMADPVITIENMNPNVIKLEYAVRGPLVIRATAIERELKEGAQKPFTEVTKANIGDAHAMGQKPITFIRQVVSICLHPALLNDPSLPEDVKERARGILAGCKGASLGSYTDSSGIEVIRRHVAEYIQARDGGIPADWNHIILCGGASDGIKALMQLMTDHTSAEKLGVMVPIPQYPLYSATVAEYDLHQISYYLDEEHNWGVNIDELERSIAEHSSKCKPRLLVVINPGNPTGQVQSRKNIEDVIKFAHKHKLLLLADEVYQHNVYAEGCEFHSFKKVLMEMGPPYSTMQMASFMSVSKGYMGECGLRGGYGEYLNFPDDVWKMYLKMLSAKLCSTTIGQAVVECVANPPRPGEASYESYVAERDGILSSLAERARLVAETFNSVPGMKCNTVQGAMYAFPRIYLPDKAIEAAKAAGQAPDAFYAFQLLESTGICVVPGSGFGQRPGTYHFRTTILPQPEQLKSMLEKFRVFHTDFVNKYS